MKRTRMTLFWMETSFMLILCGIALGLACSVPPPECPEVPECPPVECPEVPECEGEGCELKCVCEEEPPPAPQDPCAIPISQRQRTDYIPLSRAEARQAELQTYDNDLHNNGWVGPGYALQHCGPDSEISVFPYGGMDAEETAKVMEAARLTKLRLTGADGESGFYGNFAKEHENHPGRSRVFRPCYSKWTAQARELLYGDGTPSNPKGPVSGLDGIMGACKAQGG